MRNSTISRLQASNYFKHLVRLAVILSAVTGLIGLLHYSQNWRLTPTPANQSQSASLLAQPNLKAGASSKAPVTIPTQPNRAQLNESFGKLPLYFIENRGQLNARVAYYVQGRDKTLYFTPQGITFALAEQPEPQTAAETSVQKASLRPATFAASTERASKQQRWSLKLDFVGANPNVKPSGQTLTPTVISYFKGTQDHWQTGLKTYSSIVYSDLWPGIDLVYSGTVNQLKYQFVVKPGADPSQIRLAYRGATSVKLNQDGQLEVATPVGSFHDQQPYSYQEVQGEQRAVETSYALGTAKAQGASVYGFRVGAYDRGKTLVIDPVVLVYCGYIGGAQGDSGSAIAVDDEGNAYVTGNTSSTEDTFPETVGPYLNYHPVPNCLPGYCPDAFVAKVKADGTALIYAGYLGGLGTDVGSGIAVDSDQNAYITGTTNSSNFPVTPGAFDTTFTGCSSDAFVVRVNREGTALVYSTYLGGAISYAGNCGGEGGTAIAVDNSGKAYITGYTDACTGFPVKVGPDLTHGFCFTNDAFVAKLDTNASGNASLIYCGYIGGDGYDFGYGIAVDSAGSAYVTGAAGSVLPVTAGAFDTTHNGGGYDAFVAKVKADGTGFVYVTYIGGAGEDGGNGIALDGDGNAYIIGNTKSSNFPVTPGAFDTTLNGTSDAIDAFVAKLNAAGSNLIYSTYLGGSGLESGNAITVDSFGNAYLTGRTGSSEATFPVVGGPDLTFNLGNVPTTYVAKLNATATGFYYCGYLGSDSNSSGNGIALDAAGNVYVAGSTGPDLPVIVGPDLTYNGAGDAFVAKISTAANGVVGANNPPDAVNDSAITNQGFAVTISVLSNDTDPNGDLLSVTGVTQGGNGSVVLNGNGAVTYTSNASFTGNDSFTYAIGDGRGGTDTATVTITVNANSGGGNCTPPPSGMVAWWPGDGNANDIQGSNNGTLQNGATFAAGKVGQAFSFDGVNDYVDVPTSSGLPTSTWTIDFWFFLNSNTTSQAFVTNFDGSGSRYVIEYHATLGLRLGHFATFPDLNSSVKPSAGVWHHLTAIQSTNPGIGQSLYLDGNLIGTAGANIADPTIHLKFGQRGDGTFFLNGMLDEIEVFNRALSASEIQAIVNAGSAGKCKPTCVTPPSGLVSWLPGDGNANDIQGSNHGTLMNGATFAAGEVAQAFSFDGVNDYVSLPNNAAWNFGTGNFTVGFWERSSNSVSRMHALSFEPSYGTRNLDFDFNDSGGLFVYWNSSGANRILVGSQGAYTNGAWHHIALTRSGTSFTLYVNGSVVGSATYSGAIDLSNSTINYIGAAGVGSTTPTFFWNGQIDEVEIFNRALSAAEIQAIVHADSAGKCKNRPPVAVCQSVTVSAGANCTATASIDNGSSDPDGDPITITQSPAGPYPLGNTVVELTVTDGKGASSQCTAIVTVIDQTLPQITAPANASYQCLSQVPPQNPAQATATDNCGTPIITVADASNGGAGSPASPLIITRVFTARDAAGNQNSAPQAITVIDNTPPSITAPPNVTVNTGAGATLCGAVVSEAALGAATASDNCGSATITRSGVPAGNFFPVGTTTITYTATDGKGNTQTAAQTVTVIDNTPPAISCPAGTTVSANASCQAAVPNLTGEVSATDNCTTAGSLTITQSPAAGTLIGLGTTPVTITVKDAAGNLVTCTAMMTVIDNTPPTITTCPAPQSANANANCQAAVPDFTGGVAATDNCTASGSLTITQSPAAGTPVGLGTTPVTITVKDAANNTVTCLTSFTVSDNTPPVISCPAGTTVSANASCQAAVPNVLGGVTASDNCTLAGSLTKTQSPAAGTLVGLGTTMITVMVTDAAGNTSTCTTPFTVVDTTLPTITACATNKTLFANGNGQAPIPNLTAEVSATDNCTTATAITQAPAAGTLVGVGTTPVTITVKDAAGNAATCAATVTVNKRPTSITYTGETIIANGGPAILSGVLVDTTPPLGPNPVPIVGRTVNLTLGSGPGAQSCTAVTNSSGLAQCTINGVNQPLGPGGMVSASFGGDNVYLPASATAATLIFAFPAGGGNFAIGDLNARVGNAVTFWGAQWWKLNSLSGGAAPASFKGFIDHLSASPPSCGGGWTTDPGNSSNPPPSIPSYLGVIVSSSITKSGSTIAGDIMQIVIVKTDPGYAPIQGTRGLAL